MMNKEAFKKLQKKLDDAVGKRIDEFCQSALANNHKANHCAHFVSHMLDYDLPNTASCKTMNLADKKNNAVVGASIRVNEIYNLILKTRKSPISASNSACYAPGLVFVTQKRNIKINGKMGSGVKHIGIFLNQWVYHYGNRGDKIKKERLGSFIRTFTRSSPYRNHPPVLFFHGDFLS